MNTGSLRKVITESGVAYKVATAPLVIGSGILGAGFGAAVGALGGAAVGALGGAGAGVTGAKKVLYDDIDLRDQSEKFMNNKTRNQAKKINSIIKQFRKEKHVK